MASAMLAYLLLLRPGGVMPVSMSEGMLDIAFRPIRCTLPTPLCETASKSVVIWGGFGQSSAQRRRHNCTPRSTTWLCLTLDSTCRFSH